MVENNPRRTPSGETRAEAQRRGGVFEPAWGEGQCSNPCLFGEIHEVYRFPPTKPVAGITSTPQANLPIPPPRLCASSPHPVPHCLQLCLNGLFGQPLAGGRSKRHAPSCVASRQWLFDPSDPSDPSDHCRNRNRDRSPPGMAPGPHAPLKPHCRVGSEPQQYGCGIRFLMPESQHARILSIPTPIPRFLHLRIQLPHLQRLNPDIAELDLRAMVLQLDRTIRRPLLQASSGLVGDRVIVMHKPAV